MTKNSRAERNKRLEALLRAQRINEILKAGGVQSQALLDSAGETRPTDESHVADLLENERFTRAETARPRTKAKRPKKSKHLRRARPKSRSRPKHRR